jgi:hypothetical protein
MSMACHPARGGGVGQDRGELLAVPQAQGEAQAVLDVTDVGFELACDGSRRTAGRCPVGHTVPRARSEQMIERYRMEPLVRGFMITVAVICATVVILAVVLANLHAGSHS